MNKMVRSGLVIFLCGVLGCSKKDRYNTNTEPLDVQAYRLIDMGREDEAIALLSEEIELLDSEKAEGEIDESDYAIQLKVTLASAYAKKSGITIRSLVNSYSLIKKISSVRAISVKNQSSAQMETELKKFSEFILDYFRFSQTLLVLPRVELKKIIYLEQANKILDSAKPKNPADLIYTALLKIILARTLIDVDAFKLVLPAVKTLNHRCVIDIKSLTSQLKKTSGLVLESLNAVLVAMPENAEEISRALEDVTIFSSRLNDLDTSVGVLSSFDKKAVIRIFESLGIEPPNVECGFD